MFFLNFLLFFNFSNSLINSCVFVSNFSKIIYINKIIDGDTIKDLNNNTYRILGVDAPETYNAKDNFKPTIGIRYLYGSLAKNLLIKTILKKYIEIEILKKDAYSRFIAKLTINDKIDVGKLLIKNGYAITKYISNNMKSPFYYYDYSYIKELETIQNWAKNNKIGLWSEKGKFNEIYPKL